MDDSWTCLGVEKGPGILDDEVRMALKTAACMLYAKKVDMMRIEDELISGLIKTDWKTCLVGTRSGVLFHAQLDCSTGNDYRVNFLYHEDDLIRGAEHLGDSTFEQEVIMPGPERKVPKELYEFPELRGPSRRIH